jgi:hypothetical protein
VADEDAVGVCEADGETDALLLVVDVNEADDEPVAEPEPEELPDGVNDDEAVHDPVMDHDGTDSKSPRQADKAAVELSRDARTSARAMSRVVMLLEQAAR